MKNYIVFCGRIRDQRFLKTQHRDGTVTMTQNIKKAKKLSETRAQAVVRNLILLDLHFLPAYKKAEAEQT